eukprot:scaffold13003_cov70-Phaeocystis_antarctica.AAC.7
MHRSQPRRPGSGGGGGGGGSGGGGSVGEGGGGGGGGGDKGGGGGGAQLLVCAGRQQPLLKHRGPHPRTAAAAAAAAVFAAVFAAAAAHGGAQQQRGTEAEQAKREAAEVEGPRVHGLGLAAHAQQPEDSARPAGEHRGRPPHDEALGEADGLYDGHDGEIAGAPERAAEDCERLEGRRRR